MANHNFKIGDRVHHSSIKPAKGYDLVIIGFDKYGDSAIVGNKDGGHEGSNNDYYHNENGDYVGKSLLNGKTSGFWYIELKELRNLTEMESTITPAEGKIYLLKGLGFGRECYHGYTPLQSKEIDNEYVLVKSCYGKSNTVIILTGKKRGYTYFLNADDFSNSTLNKRDFPTDTQKFFDKDYQKEEEIRKGGSITKKAGDGTTTTVHTKTSTEKAVILLNNNKTLTVNQNY